VAAAAEASSRSATAAGVWADGRPEHVHKAGLSRQLSQGAVGLLAGDLAAVRVDGDDGPAVPLHQRGTRRAALTGWALAPTTAIVS
jgi:hypothetical protein